MSHPDSRRSFLKTVAAGATGAVTLGSLPASSYARVLGANERVSVGMIGIGGMARGHLRNLLKMPEQAQVVALCDVYGPNLDEAAQMAPEATRYTDFRRLLEQANVDAVVIGTPDHWHALPMIMACQAGKDVYVEKPTSLVVEESRAMVEAAHEHDRIVQVGTQQRSAQLYQDVREIVQSGQLGPISFVRTWNYSNAYPDGIGRPPDSAPPENLDWEMWLGPAPNVPYNPNRFGAWRRFWDYAGGRMTDWGVHHLDIVQWAMDEKSPEAASAEGGKFVIDDNGETPDTLVATFRYPSFVCTYESRAGNEHTPEAMDYGIAFHGAAGTLLVDRSRFKIVPEDGSSLEPTVQEGNGNAHAEHMRGFLESVVSREQPISDIESGHRSSTTAMLGNIAYRTGQRIRWDGEAEKITDASDEARALLSAHYRAPWSL